MVILDLRTLFQPDEVARRRKVALDKSDQFFSWRFVRTAVTDVLVSHDHVSINRDSVDTKLVMDEYEH